MFAPKCGGCGGAIMDNYISALSKQWHTDCFVCRVRTHTDCFVCRVRTHTDCFVCWIRTGSQRIVSD